MKNTTTAIQNSTFYAQTLRAMKISSTTLKGCLTVDRLNWSGYIPMLISLRTLIKVTHC
jgi:hypothetical protein